LINPVCNDGLYDDFTFSSSLLFEDQMLIYMIVGLIVKMVIVVE